MPGWGLRVGWLMRACMIRKDNGVPYGIALASRRASLVYPDTSVWTAISAA